MNKGRKIVVFMTVGPFISPDLLPPNNTDLNPVHYKHMGINATAGIASS